MEFHTIRVSGIDDVLKSIPQLTDEFELARLCNAFFNSDDDSYFHLLDMLKEAEFNDLEYMNYDFFSNDINNDDIEEDEEPLSEELLNCQAVLFETFKSIYKIYKKYHPDPKCTESVFFEALLRFQKKSSIWIDLYDETYLLFESCIKRPTHPSVEKYVVYSNVDNKLITMMVNVFDTVDKVSEESVRVAEHIYIAKGASYILHNNIHYERDRIAYNMHLFTLQHFTPYYMISNPLSIMNPVFDQLVDERKMALVWQRTLVPDNLRTIPIQLDGMEYSCERPYVLFKVLISTPQKKKSTKKSKSKSKKKTSKKSTQQTRSRSSSKSSSKGSSKSSSKSSSKGSSKSG